MLFRRSSASKPSNRGLSRRSPDGRKKRGLFLEQFEARQLMAVVDDMDTTGYSATSGFSDGAYIGYNSFRHHAYGDSSGDKATWTFSGLAPGNYRVSTTWPAAGSNSAAAPFTIRSGGTVVGAATVDQRIAPNDAQISGTWWEDLGTGIYSISGGDLTIEVSDQTTGYVMADAMRVDPWTGPEAHVTTGAAKVDDNSGTVDFGTAASWWNVEKSFTVRNAGVDSQLTLGTLSVPTGFTLVAGLGSQTLQPGESTSFTVRLDTSSPGAKSGQVSLVTNDGNENPFNFTVNGTVNNFQVIDDQDATGFTYSSGFGSGAYIGYNSYRHHANGDNTGDKATWTFNNIPAGTYRISGTWTSAPSNTAAAPFSVRSNGLVVGTALVNQRSEPNDAQSQGAWWEDLGTGIFTVATGTLSVEVSDQTTGYVIADAIRIEPWSGPEVHVIATGGIKVDDNSGVIDYGTAANWWNVDKTFTVSNAGVGSALTLGGLSIPAGFTLVSGLGTQTLQPGESTSFIVRLDTSATGTKNGQISLATNDGNENPFNFTVKGVVNNYQIVDDLDPSLFSSTSGFSNGAYLGYNTYFHYAYGDGSGDKATWTFNDLPPGTYRVSGTWPAASYASAAAPFTIRAGGSTIGTSAQNQQVAPNDFQSAGVWWEDLGTASYSVGSSPLTVEARDQTTSLVMADAVRIELLNAAPNAVNDQLSLHGWNPTTVAAPGVLTNDFDREGSALTPSTVVAPQHGTIAWQTGGGFIYTPSRDGATTDSFQYRVSDGATTSGVATVELTLTGLNSAPVASTIANRTLDEDGTLDAIALRDFFADLEDADDLLTYTATSPSSNLLELAIDDSTDNLLLNLVANAHGTAEVTVTATDTGGRSATTVFTVTVNSVNDAPSLANQLVTLDPAGLLTGQQVGQLAVTDLDAESHTFVFASGNENGGVTIDSTGRIFIADAAAFDFPAHGPYEYTLQITDPAGAVTTAQLALAASDGFSVTGPATAGQNETYTVELNGGVSFAGWTITWGDGAVSVVPGTAASASHVYQSPTSPNISATISVAEAMVTATTPGTIGVLQNQGTNLLVNGGFEERVVQNPANWYAFDWIPGWQYAPENDPRIKFELHRGVVLPAGEGMQSIELDSDQNGPDGDPISNETGSMGIQQTVATVNGRRYMLSFMIAARPNTAIGDNAVLVEIISGTTTLSLTIGTDSSTWTTEEVAFVAGGDSTTIRLTDKGVSPNLEGTLIDYVSVTHAPRVDLDIDSDNKNGLTELKEEEDIEDDASLPGRIVRMSHGDEDQDTIPDVEDQQITAPAYSFSTVKLKIPDFVDLTTATVSLEYPGNLKLWLKNSHVLRNPSSAADGGDYVAPGTYAAGDLGPLDAPFITLFVEGTGRSLAWGDQRIVANVDPDGDGELPALIADAVRLSVIQSDLDIDSDNNDGLALPARSPTEEALETLVGKQIRVNDQDLDGDGVPEFADGFNGNASTARFTPIVVELPQPFDLATAQVIFAYSASNPNDIVVTGAVHSLPSEGTIRIWKKDGNEARNRSSISSGGDYVSPTSYSASELGFSAEARSITLYVEAVKAGEDTIAISAFQEFAGQAPVTAIDVVHFAALRPALFLDVDNNSSISDEVDGIAKFLPGYVGDDALLTNDTAQTIHVMLQWYSANTAVHFALQDTTSLDGIAGNADGHAGADFVLVNDTATTDISGRAWAELSVRDFGGKTKVVATIGSETVVLEIPLDTDQDGLPNAWESKYPYLTVDYDSLSDFDSSPDVPGNFHSGDGLRAFDEYRGFMVKGTHLRTSPLVRDVFLYDATGYTTTSGPALTSIFVDKSGLRVHEINVNELSAGSGRINAYSTYAAQKAIILSRSSADGKGPGGTDEDYGEQVGGRPSQHQHTRIWFEVAAEELSFVKFLDDGQNKHLVFRDLMSPTGVWANNGKIKLGGETIAYQTGESSRSVERSLENGDIATPAAAKNLIIGDNDAVGIYNLVEATGELISMHGSTLFIYNLNGAVVSFDAGVLQTDIAWQTALAIPAGNVIYARMTVNGNSEWISFSGVAQVNNKLRLTGVERQLFGTNELLLDGASIKIPKQFVGVNRHAFGTTAADVPSNTTLIPVGILKNVTRSSTAIYAAGTKFGAFENLDDMLRALAAHELGHAVGMIHTDGTILKKAGIQRGMYIGNGLYQDYSDELKNSTIAN